jgi:hypothetical protein
MQRYGPRLLSTFVRTVAIREWNQHSPKADHASEMSAAHFRHLRAISLGPNASNAFFTLGG